MRVDASKIRVGAGGWRGAGRIRAFKGLRFYFFFPRQLKWKRDTVRTALPLTGLHPPFPSSALIIILTKALSKWAASHWSTGAVAAMTSEVSSLLLNLHWTDQNECHRGDGGQRGFCWTKAVLTSQGCWPKIKTQGHRQERGNIMKHQEKMSGQLLLPDYWIYPKFFPSPLLLGQPHLLPPTFRTVDPDTKIWISSAWSDLSGSLLTPNPAQVCRCFLTTVRVRDHFSFFNRSWNFHLITCLQELGL